jgi:hypothetical protein
MLRNIEEDWKGDAWPCKHMVSIVITQEELA